DPTAGAEAMAIHLLRTARPGISVELYPSARVGERQRQPDFCVCEPGGVWTYVEGTQPDVTEAQRRVEDVSWRLTELLADMKWNFALEVFLRREPTEGEVEAIVQRLPDFCSREGEQVEPLPDCLGLLLLNQSAPGEVVLRDHPGEETFPRLGSVKAIAG